MTKPIPDYLKLHSARPAEASKSQQSHSGGDSLTSLCDTFEQVTGWPLRIDTGEEVTSGVPAPKHAWNSPNPTAKVEVDYRSNKPSKTETPTDQRGAEEHAKSLNQLVEELQRTRHALWQREAELAAGIPVVQHSDTEKHVASRLQGLMQTAAESVACQAASLYLLDDATSHLKVRSIWGLPYERLLDGTRLLRGATADLEAMLGHAVVLNDSSALSEWRPPEHYPSAICLPVSSETSVLGTMWIFGDKSREFSEQEINMLEIIAGRVACELEREVLLEQSMKSKQLTQQLSRMSRRQQDRLPTFAPLIDEWQVAGWTHQADVVGGDFHDWSVLPDGQLAITVGDAHGEKVEAGVTAASMHAAIKSHARYRHNAEQLIERVNETLWTTSAGDQFGSLFYGILETRGGAIRYAAAGQTGAVIIRKKDWVTLPHDDLPLGTHPEGGYHLFRGELQEGDVLVAFSEGVRKSLAKLDQALAEDVIGSTLLRKRQMSSEQMVTEVRAIIDSYCPQGGHDCSILVTRRV